MPTALEQESDCLEPGTLPPLRRDREFWLVLGLLTGVFIVAIFFDAQRFVWFDELCTFNIARAKSLHQLWQWVLRFDNNPPTVYLLSRFSMWILGPTPLGLRLPSILEFYLGSVAMLVYLRRRAGTAAGAFGVAILWSSKSFYYATEARPYALVFLGFSCLLLSWDSAIKRSSRRLALWCAGLSATLLLQSHVFASLCLFAFVIAEFARYLRRHKADYPLYLALGLPMITMLLYVPLVSVYKGLILWPQFHASPWMAARFYYHSFDTIARAMFLVAFVTMLLSPLVKKSPVIRVVKSAREEWTLYSCMLLSPLLLNLLLMHREGDFFDRYTLTANVVLYGMLAVLYVVQLRFNRVIAYTATFLMLILMVHSVRRDWIKRPRQLNPETLATLHPDLPIVVSNGATFIEMSQHESPQVVSRLYYIKDRAASIKWDGTNYYYDFEAIDDLKRAGWPIGGNVEPYSQFISQHRQFLIYADPYEWLPLKLQQDGATFTLVMGFLNAPHLGQPAVTQASDPLSGPSGAAPHINYPTPFVSQGTPYIATHIYLVNMPVKVKTR